jgi:hypothetical protein
MGHSGFGGLAFAILSRTHAAPPSALHFSHSASVMRSGRDFMSSPVGLVGLRPCPRSLCGFLSIGELYTIPRLFAHMQI